MTTLVLKKIEQNIPLKSWSDIKRVYNGDAPLVYTYWYFHLAVCGGLAAASNLIDRYGINIENNYLILFLGITQLILLAIYYPCFFISNIAVWRSANKYQGKAIWKNLAKISVIMSLILMLFTLYILYK